MLATLDKLKALPSLEAVWEFCQQNFVYLGEGNSRAGFALDENVVIKVSMDEPCTENETEARVGRNPKWKRFVPEVYDSHPQFWWIAVERVEPLSDEEALEFTGIPETVLGPVLDGGDWYKMLEEYPVSEEKERFLKDFLGFVRGSGITSYALDWHQEWGRAKDGRVVLMDYE